MSYPLIIISAQDKGKKVMDHSLYTDWKSINNIQISNNGQWIAYEVNPNLGNGLLHLQNLEDGYMKTFERGYMPRFSPESDYLVYKIKPPYQVIRQAKKDKKAKDKMPKDSLGIYRLDLDLLSKVPRVEEFSVPEKSSSWFVIKHYYKKDTSSTDTNQYGVPLAIAKGRPSTLVVMNPVTDQKHVFEKVYDYDISENGRAVAFSQFARLGDSIAGRSVRLMNTRKEMIDEVYIAEGSFGRMSLDPEGKQLAFLHHADSAKAEGMNMHYWTDKKKTADIILDSISDGMPEGWGISNNGELQFSADGSRLYFGTAPVPEPEHEDTLLEDEKFQVDIWNWQDGLIQPMQKKMAEQELKRSYQAIWHVGYEGMIQLADEQMESLVTMYRGNGDLALGSSSRPYEKLISWKGNRFLDYYLLNTATGEREQILKEKAFPVKLSPAGKYIVWYEADDSNYYSHDIENAELNCLTCGIEADFHNIDHDLPSMPGPYGIAGFTEKDESVLIYSQYDIWKIDPAAQKLPINLTEYSGTKNKITFRYRHLEYDNPFIPLKKNIFLEGFHEESKEMWIYSGSALLSGEPFALTRGNYRYQIKARSREGNVLCWSREDFDEYPDLYISDPDFGQQKRISDANPQSGEYYWGNPELVQWTSYSGDEIDGILYLPENFNPAEKYPMLVYFYEKKSDRLYSHVSPSPSRSTINIAWAASNGYVVFTPDIPYRIGYPGQSAYDAVHSGTLAMCERYSFIDRDNMGINGQSWGGYQVAWLVTRTNLFKAAMAGAPVSNMTSAYGGIRWSSGMSRMMQYEEGQSRIGGSLWDKTDLYMENSPLFGVPDIETPILIMHNDNDGAVPWYQGIEFFAALRRLEKPAWMLVYNNEEHNLGKWPNRVDLSIRMMQFFDHYLKSAAIPKWMSSGIPAIEKGKTDAYELINNGDK